MPGPVNASERIADLLRDVSAIQTKLTELGAALGVDLPSSPLVGAPAVWPAHETAPQGEPGRYKTRRKPFTAHEEQQMIALAKAGIPVQEIARKFDCAVSSVRQLKSWAKPARKE